MIMNTSFSGRALICLLVLSAFSSNILAQSISVDRTHLFNQTGPSTATSAVTPFSFNVHVRGGTTNMTAWGPAFYKAGSGGVPQSGTSTATNTGTLNLPVSPNNGGDFMFVHRFPTADAVAAFYPIAPTGAGQYGVKFLGSAPPSPTDFSQGLIFSAGPTYPSAVPRVSNADNGASWNGNTLQLNPTGVTTLTINTFPEYNSATYGAFIVGGVYSNSGSGVVEEAAASSYYLPGGDSSTPPITPVNQPAVTKLTIDGSWLTPGHSYTLDLHFAIIASQPEESLLNGINFQGLAVYRNLTTIRLAVGYPKAVISGGSSVDGNSRDDILWSNGSTGEQAVWQMNGTINESGAVIGSIPTEWSASGTGDFDGDGRGDLFWTNTDTGDRAAWLMNGPSIANNVYLSQVPLAWALSGVGDFNGDGRDDILWTNLNTGDRAMWFMSGSGSAGGGYLTNVPLVWQVRGTGDYNGDGKADIVWSNTSTGERAMWLMDGTTLASGAIIGTVPVEWSISASGDYNGDGKADLLWTNTITGDRAVWLMNGAMLAQNAYLTQVPLEWEISGAGDYNGDGKADVLWTNTATGDRAMWFMNGGSALGGGYLTNVPLEWSVVP